MFREENKRRAQDEKRSSYAHLMLENNFYKPQTTGYKSVYDKDTQVKGVDTVFTYNGREYHCDEKAAVNYVGKDLQTFSLEISFIDRANNTVDGWFVKEGSKTDSYIFVWFDEDTYELALVRKSKIESYLESHGWDVYKLLRKAEKIRDEGDINFGNIHKNGVKFSFSNYYYMPEKPINILVPRKELVKMAVFANKFKYEEEDKIIFGLK